MSDRSLDKSELQKASLENFESRTNASIIMYERKPYSMKITHTHDDIIFASGYIFIFILQMNAQDPAFIENTVGPDITCQKKSSKSVFTLYDFTTTCCIITGLFISLKKHCENVAEKEPIFADEGATVRALLKNKNGEKYI
jgi:hypothetical protein